MVVSSVLTEVVTGAFVDSKVEDCGGIRVVVLSIALLVLRTVLWLVL